MSYGIGTACGTDALCSSLSKKQICKFNHHHQANYLNYYSSCTVIASSGLALNLMPGFELSRKCRTSSLIRSYAYGIDIDGIENNDNTEEQDPFLQADFDLFIDDGGVVEYEAWQEWVPSSPEDLANPAKFIVNAGNGQYHVLDETSQLQLTMSSR
jgi:hypothetical protein